MAEETATSKTHKRLKLTRSIVLDGDHAEAGSTHDVPNALAHRLVGEGSAEHVDPQQKATTVNRMETPSNRDPKSKQVAPAPAKGGPKE